MKILLKLLTFVLFTFVLGMPDKCDTLDGESINNCKELNQLSQESEEGRDTVTTCDCGYDGDEHKMCCSPSVLNKHPTSKSTSDKIKDKEDVVGMCGGRCRERSQGSVYRYLTQKVIPDLTSTTMSTSTEFNYFTNGPLDDIKFDETSYPEIHYCGFDVSSENKVYGGIATAIDEYPWLAMLEYDRPFLCGGTLISSYYVLTAAHCLVAETMKPRGVTSVRLGEYNTATDGSDCVEADGAGFDCTDGAISITISDIIVHPEYNNANSIIVHANDIGLLRLNESSPYTDFIRPICLPSTDVTQLALQNRSSTFRFHVAGWGAVSDNQQRSDVKLQLQLPITDQKECEKLYSMKGKPLIWDKQFCAGGVKNEDTCKGDSGGPLIYSDDDIKIHHQIVGITSFGILKCGSQGRPSIYTKVIEYVPWILANMKPVIS